MPYITDTQKLESAFLKRNVKLLPCQKEMIKYWYNEGNSINGIAKMFKVNKRTIQFILFPERRKRNLELRKERGGSKQYYDKDKHKEAMKDHRRYKYKTLKSYVNE